MRRSILLSGRSLVISLGSSTMVKVEEHAKHAIGPDKTDPLGKSNPSAAADGAIRSTASSPPAYILKKMRLTKDPSFKYLRSTNARRLSAASVRVRGLKHFVAARQLSATQGRLLLSQSRAVHATSISLERKTVVYALRNRESVLRRQVYSRYMSRLRTG
jgi:hypothetical protein